MADRSLVPRKQRRRAVQQRLLPGVDLAGMHTKPARQLGNRAILPDRCQRHLRLELRTVLLPCIRQVSPPAKPPSQRKTLSYQPVQFSGTTSRRRNGAGPERDNVVLARPAAGEPPATGGSARSPGFAASTASNTRRGGRGRDGQ